MDSEQRDVRISKLERIREAGIQAYPDRFEATHTCAQARELPVDHDGVRVAGRLMARRVMGKLSFGHVQDGTGKIQISVERGRVSEQEEKLYKKLLDLGDHVGVEGKIWATQTGEPTIGVDKLTFLGKALRPLPEKWHGLKDQELRYRQRYLDLVMSEDTREVFRIRSRMIASIRRFLDDHRFMEVETPILQGAASGAAARPFITHHNALDTDLYLRISPETYLKRLIAGGMDRVYEIGKNFRNEGLDPSHLQEFTMLEYYAAYWNWRDNMKFIREMIQGLLMESVGTLQISYGDQTLDFSGEWREATFRDLVLEDSGIDLDQIENLEELKKAVKASDVHLDPDDFPSLPSLMDALYKKISRPKLIQPMFLTRHPSCLVPLARRSDDNPDRLDMFQVVVNTWEMVKAYSELVDPIDQHARMTEQMDMREAGDDETMMMEDDYIECMEHGMPPISGLGFGIDRFLCLVTQKSSLRDVVFFPTMKRIEG